MPSERLSRTSAFTQLSADLALETVSYFQIDPDRDFDLLPAWMQQMIAGTFRNQKVTLRDCLFWAKLVEFLKLEGPLILGLLKFQVEWDPHLPSVYPTVIRFISPSIQRLRVTCEKNETLHVSPILCYLCNIGGNPEDIWITGYPTKSLLSTLHSFTALRKLSFDLPEEKSPPVSLLLLHEIVEAAPALRILGIDPHAMRINSTPARTAFGPTFRHLVISGTPGDLAQFLSNDLTSSTQISMEMFVRGSFHRTAWKDIAEATVQAFPAIQHLHFDGQADDPPLLLLEFHFSEHLSSFRVTELLLKSNRRQARRWKRSTSVV
ncbi:hypothetical protein NP233_g12972 [Leucocoprinus birnbaumii]|uniref:Uncharacterized protein n=1 Tax=Leucocoprinus birnbaumii TaxID=56174 RepID=A0AAD5YMK8_9AGAR|nr:hypothetical protein NP233_g12972 [Leucocoprinus birnbaumii]